MNIYIYYEDYILCGCSLMFDSTRLYDCHYELYVFVSAASVSNTMWLADSRFDHVRMYVRTLYTLLEVCVRTEWFVYCHCM